MSPISIKHKLITSDANYIVEQIEPLANELKNATVLVTGASGLIGSLTVCSLALLNKTHNLGIKIIVTGRSEKRLRSQFQAYKFCSNIIYHQGDIRNALSLSENITHIIHGASSTSSQYFVSHPVETLDTAIEGTRNVLHLAQEKNILSMVYLSSLEVYGLLDNHPKNITEEESGYLNTLSVRSSYSEGKRICETLCASYVSEFNTPIKIARLTQTFGPGVEYDDGRVFAEFMRCALEERPIVLRSEGKTTRNYCYTADAVSGILYILIKGNNGEAYNIANENTAISIYQMAELAKQKLGFQNTEIRIEIPADIASYGYNPEMIAKLDSTKLQQLGWQPNFSLEEAFERMAKPYQ